MQALLFRAKYDLVTAGASLEEVKPQILALENMRKL